MNRIAAAIASVLALAFTATGAPLDWPFYVPQDTAVPSVNNAEWCINDVDRFVLRRLEDKGLAPAEGASKRTLVRRLYFDLIGLPPTPEQVEAFVNDDDPEAYSKLVDQLLDDPRYGERWARFWLDLARYADTAGYEGDPDMPHAWRYRDYVIDSLNRDKPYDLFIREQIAGDEFNEIMGAGELPLPSAEQTVAMTFLRLAPFTEPRGDETRHEMLSEITSTVGSVFLGLTVGCAKCHDHRHDDIPTADFYRMKAFFATVQIPPPERGDGFQIGGALPADFYREDEEKWAEATRNRIQKEASTAKDELAKLKSQIQSRLSTDSPAVAAAGFGIQVINGSGNNYVFEKYGVNDGQPRWSVINSNSKEWSIVSDGRFDKEAGLGSLSGGNKGEWFADLKQPAFVSLGQHTAGTGKTKGGHHDGRFAEVLIYADPLDDASKSALSEYVQRKYRGGEKQSTDADHSPPQDGLRFWLDAGDLDADPATVNPKEGSVSEWKDRIAGITLTQSKDELQPEISTLGPNDVPAIAFSQDLLVGQLGDAAFAKDQQGAIVVIYSATHTNEGYGFEVGGDGQFLTTLINPSAVKNDDDPIDRLVNENDPRITVEERHRYEFLSTRDRFTKQHLKRLKPVAMSLRHSFGPPYEPGVPVSRIMIRGEYDAPGDVVEPGFLTAITGKEEPAKIRLDPFKRWPTRSRRMTLAQWIASPKNPMTAKVMVNRLWHLHFGQGIVQTPSDFGDLSDGPSHRELLDWMAEKFVAEKWSIKAMHRLMVQSATYRQVSSRSDAVADKGKEIDPENRLLWKFNRRRLEAEAVRDNVLTVSGRLNPEQFGLPIFPPLPDDIAKTVKYDQTKWDTQYGPEGRKRSIYIYQQRTLTMPFMQTFDSLVCDESRPRRESSVTPLQALAMYNSDFVNEEAKHFARRVRDVVGDDAEKQIEHAFDIALGRKPTAEEAKEMKSLVESEAGLSGLCRVLYNTSEFLYID